MPQLDILEIRKLLPHRYPFLLVDRITDIGDDFVIGIKNVTNNEPFFNGHFPDFPVMPGVLIIEAMAQVAGVLVLGKIPDRANKNVFLATVDGARFKRPVVPGDQLRIEMKLTHGRPTRAKMEGKAYVGDMVVAEATIMCILQDKGPLQAGTPSSAQDA
jgi:beta-hydroxyacyl-ACP dehydratase FabZ